MQPRPHMPHILGCAIGFAAAGWGAGSIVGWAVTPLFFPQPPQTQPTPHQQYRSLYGGINWGMVIGAAVGLVAGVVYAVVVRWKRRRLP